MNRLMARLYFSNNGTYPSWYVRSQLKDKLCEIALSTWGPKDVDTALAEVAKLLGCLPDRIQVDSR